MQEEESRTERTRIESKENQLTEEPGAAQKKGFARYKKVN